MAQKLALGALLVGFAVTAAPSYAKKSHTVTLKIPFKVSGVPAYQKIKFNCWVSDESGVSIPYSGTKILSVSASKKGTINKTVKVKLKLSGEILENGRGYGCRMSTYENHMGTKQKPGSTLVDRIKGSILR